MDAIAAVNATTTTVAKALDYFKNNVAGHFTDTSMTAITKLTRAEPLTVISNDCSNLSYLPDLMNTLCSVYSGYYLQAVSMLTQIRDVEVVRILDRLNPDRDSTGFLLAGRMATENAYNRNHSYKYSLPTARVMAMESDRNHLADPKVDRVAQSALYEASNLAVGKLLNVPISVVTKANEEKTINMPISVRLSPTLVPVETVNYIFTHRSVSPDDWFEKWHAWRAGRIGLIKDAIFSQNMIDEYRRAAIKDRSGTLQEIVRRAANAKTYGVLTNNPSLAVSTNLYILSKSAAMAIEQKTGYKFSSGSGRKKLLEGTYGMIIVVVDPDREMIDFYYRDIEQPTRISVRSLQAAAKKKDGVDIADVMRSLLEGKTPTF